MPPSLELEDVLRTVVVSAAEITGAPLVSIWTADEGARTLERRAVSDERLAREYPLFSQPYGPGAAGWVALHRRPLHVPDIRRDDRMLAPEWFLARGLTSFLGLPIVFERSLLGVLCLMGRARFKIGAAERRRLEAFIVQAATAIRNARHFAQNEARRRSAEALAEMGRVISRGLDPDVVAGRIAESVRDLLDVLASAVYREDPQSGGVTLLARSTQADSGFQWTPSFGPGEGLVGLAIREGQTIATEDVAGDERIIYTADQRARLERVPYRAGLAVPLFAQGRINGVLVVAGRAGRVFTREEVATAQAFAGHAAVALDNARLYDEARRRQHEAEALASVARNLTESLDVADVGRRIVESVLPLFDVRSAGLRLLRPDGSLETVARSEVAGVHSNPGDVLPPGIGISGRTVAGGRPVRTSNVIADPGIVLADHLREQAVASGLAALLAVPLRVKGRIIGALSVADREGRVFSDAEAALLSILADEAALALENARLYGEAREREHEAAVVAELSSGMSTSLELDLVLQRVAEGARELCGSDMARVALLAPGGQAMTFRYRVGTRYEGYDIFQIERGRGMGGVAWETRRPLRTRNWFEDPTVAPDYMDLVRAEGIVSTLVVPILIEGDVHGLIYVDNRGPHSFSQRDENVLVHLAQHAAVAIRNAEIYGEAERRRREAELLAGLARSVNESLEVDVVLGRMAAAIHELCRCDITRIALRAPESGAMMVRYWVGAGSEEWLVRAFEPGKGVGGQVLLTGRPARTADYANDPSFSKDYAAVAASEGTVTLICVPILIQGQVEGLLFAINKTPRAFTDRDEAILVQIADQAATAIHNAQLFAREQAARAEAEASGRALRASEARLLEAQRIGRVGSWEADVRGSALEWSEETFRIFGRDPAGFVPTNEAFAEAIHPDDRDMVRRATAEALRTGQPYRVEHRIILPDGSQRVVLEQAEVVGDDSGRPARLAGTVQDITDRTAAEERLRASEERYRALVEHAPDAIVVLDVHSGLYVDVNQHATRLFGLDRAELLRSGPLALSPARQADGRLSADAGREWIRKALRGDTPTFEWTHRNRAGDLIVCEVSLVRLPDPTRTLIRGSIFDITDRKRAEETRARLEEELRQAQKMEAVGRLAGGVAHDFNNLLTVIGGRSALMAAKLHAEDPLHRDVGLIQATTRKATALTQQLLAFSRKQVMQPKVLDLNTVVSAIEQMLRRLIGEDVEVITALAADLWLVEADPTQVDQVIMNLAVNARDAMTAGGRLTLRTANARIGAATPDHADAIPPGEYAVLSVSDTGVGMNAETLARVFEPFFTTKEVGKGTGLGLSTVYGIVTQSGGRITVESEPGRGTAFTIYLPRVEQAEEAAVPPSAGAGPPSGRETILLVEDESEVRDLARDILEMHGYTVLASAAPADAERVCREHAGRIQLLLTDVVMPGMSGRALAERLRDQRPAMKVLYMSGYDDAAIVKHGVLEPGVTLLPKPFSADDLAGKVREVLDRGQALRS
jgi:PAS domain S-box-containing protein